MDTYTDLLQALRARGATHASIAASLGVSRTTVQSWEARGRIPPEHWRGLQRVAETERMVLSLGTLVHMAEVAAGKRAAEQVLQEAM